MGNLRRCSLRDPNAVGTGPRAALELHTQNIALSETRRIARVQALPLVQSGYSAPCCDIVQGILSQCSPVDWYQRLERTNTPHLHGTKYIPNPETESKYFTKRC